MAIKLDQNLLVELGLGSMPDEEKRALLNHIYETLEMRVGMRLADQMSNEQLDEFEKYFEAKDDAGAFHWLETNFPNYKQIVEDEYVKLKEEVRQSAPQILQAALSNQVQQPAQTYANSEPNQLASDNFIPPAPSQPMPTDDGQTLPPYTPGV